MEYSDFLIRVFLVITALIAIKTFYDMLTAAPCTPRRGLVAIMFYTVVAVAALVFDFPDKAPIVVWSVLVVILKFLYIAPPDNQRRR